MNLVDPDGHFACALPFCCYSWDDIQFYYAAMSRLFLFGPPDIPEPFYGGSVVGVDLQAIAQNLLPDAKNQAASGLRRDDCKALFGKAPVSAGAPVFTIDQLWNGTANGYKWTVKFEHFGNTKIALTSLSGTVDANGFQHLEAITKINLDYDSGEYWNSGNTANNANTLLHEFGHALRLFRFTGGGFVQADEDYDVNRRNTNLINTNCLQ